MYISLKGTANGQGTWVAQLVKCPILGFSSGHDLMVHEDEAHIRLCAGRDSLGSETAGRDIPAWDSCCAPPLLALSLSLSLKINNKH